MGDGVGLWDGTRRKRSMLFFLVQPAVQPAKVNLGDGGDRPGIWSSSLYTPARSRRYVLFLLSPVNSFLSSCFSAVCTPLSHIASESDVQRTQRQPLADSGRYGRGGTMDMEITPVTQQARGERQQERYHAPMQVHVLGLVLYSR
jgi:hypothetical protein